MLQFGAVLIVNDRNDIETHFLAQIPGLNIVICTQDNLPLFLFGNCHPGFTNFSRLPGFYFHHDDLIVLLCNDVDFKLEIAVIRFPDSVPVFQQEPLRHLFSEHA